MSLFFSANFKKQKFGGNFLFFRTASKVVNALKKHVKNACLQLLNEQNGARKAVALPEDKNVSENHMQKQNHVISETFCIIKHQI